MQLSQTRSQRNSFGPFGYAIGHPTPRRDLRLRLAIRRLQVVEARRGADGRAVDAGAPDLGARAALPLGASARPRSWRCCANCRCFRRTRASPMSIPTTAAASRGGDALAAAGVGNFVDPGAAPAPGQAGGSRAETDMHEDAEPSPAVITSAWSTDVEERAAAEDPPIATPSTCRCPAAPARAAPAPSAANPLLAPLAARDAQARRRRHAAAEPQRRRRTRDARAGAGAGEIVLRPPAELNGAA